MNATRIAHRKLTRWTWRLPAGAVIPYYSFYLLCVDSQPENNEYGPNPKGLGNDEINEIGNHQEK